MNIFQKIAIFLLRLFGIAVFFFGVSGFIDVIKVSSSAPTAGLLGAAGTMSLTVVLNGIIITSFIYLILGLVIYFVSLPLGKLIGRNLDN